MLPANSAHDAGETEVDGSADPSGPDGQRDDLCEVRVHREGVFVGCHAPAIAADFEEAPDDGEEPEEPGAVPDALDDVCVEEDREEDHQGQVGGVVRDVWVAAVACGDGAGGEGAVLDWDAGGG